MEWWLYIYMMTYMVYKKLGKESIGNIIQWNVQNAVWTATNQISFNNMNLQIIKCLSTGGLKKMFFCYILILTSEGLPSENYT